MGLELRSLKASLDAMGAVNITAPEDYAARKESIDFWNHSPKICKKPWMI